MISQSKMNHAIEMMFQLDLMVDGERQIRTARENTVANPSRPNFNPVYTELIFVHSKSDAVDLPDNVIMAWPCCFSIGVLELLNEAVNRSEDELFFWARNRREVLHLEDFGLTYPITLIDLVNNWEQVRDVWIRLTPDEQQGILIDGPLVIALRVGAGEHFCCLERPISDTP